jgi:uncharacterized repeat protein (TIGR01451 family)
MRFAIQDSLIRPPKTWTPWALLASLALCLWADTGYASHMAGAEISYECINSCTIRVHLRNYRDCSGSTAVVTNITFTPQAPGCSGVPTPIAGWSAQQSTELSPLCPNSATMCTTPGAPINGIEEYYWSRDYDICAVPGCIFTLGWSTCCRSPIINSILSPGSTSIEISSVTLNTNFATCNSSPLFSHPAAPYICIGQPFSFSQAATDADGDSLSYTLASCMSGPATAVTYNAGYSATQPLGPSWNVQIDNNTGLLSFTPVPGNAVTGVICIFVQEWRNGNMIGQVTRDIQVHAITCNSYCGNNLVEGVVFDDANSNCVLDPGEPTMHNVQVVINSGMGVVTTNAQGVYRAWVSAGTHTFELNASQNTLYQVNCPPSGVHTVTFSSQNDTSLHNDFGRVTSVYCPQMWVDVASFLIRPCLVSQYVVSYCNQGTDTAFNAYVTVELEAFQTYQSVSGATWVSSNGDVHTFSVGDVRHGGCGNFSLNAITDCNTNLTGATACVEAHIYPDSSCLPANPAWDHSSVSVAGGCVGDSLSCYTVTNSGQAMQGPTDWRFYRNSQLLYSGTLQLCGGCDTVLCFTANGSTDRLEVDQRPNHPGNSHPNDVVELCGQPNATMGQVMAMALDDADDFVDIFCHTVVNSYDPNSKHVSPSGALTPYFYVDSTAALTYVIDFQNTGSADALRVVLEDSLDPRLDILTVQPGSSSHPYTFSVLSGRRLQFVFDSINLPPQSQNADGSMGWVQYRVNQVPGNTFGDEIHNSCDIFFDMNPPIRTNTVLNTVGWPEQTVSIDGDGISAQISIWPNPAQNEAFARVTGLQVDARLRIELYALTGQRVYAGEFANDQTYRIDLSDLADGVYVYRVTSDGGLLKTGKVVLR